MELSFEQIKSIAKGVVRVESNDGRIALLRFTKKQEDAYKDRNDDFFKKVFATAGVRLEFSTNSTSLFLKTNVRPASSRRFCAHDIFCNGKLIGQLGASFNNFAPDVEPAEISGKFYLGEGEKNVCIYFPWSFASEICELSLDDGSFVAPTEKSINMIMFGDSITHGYDALLPSNSYASRVADMLDANAINKGIGGEVFWPELADMTDDITPDIITVAYGTNDWGGGCSSKEEFEQHCKAFYENLSKAYPHAKIFALSPIWRVDCQNPSKVGDFKYVHDYFDTLAAEIDNVIHLNAYDFGPHDVLMMGDRFVHPNDEGFEYYANALFAEIKKNI